MSRPVPLLLKAVISRCCKWARTNGCPWDEDTCAYAAEGGHLEVLQWARMPMDAPGMRTPVPMLLKAVISRCCSGQSQMVVHTIETSCADANVKEWLAAGVLKL